MMYGKNLVDILAHYAVFLGKLSKIYYYFLN